MVNKYILSMELYIIFNSQFAQSAAESIGDYPILYLYKKKSETERSVLWQYSIKNRNISTKKIELTLYSASDTREYVGK